MTNETSFLLIKEFLDEKYFQYNQRQFIENDPIAIPHYFSRQEDIEIAGFLAATIAWGQRPQILKKGFEMMELMDYSPYEFVKDHNNTDLKRFEKFVYRTFNSDDLSYFIKSLNYLVNEYKTLGALFKSIYYQSSDMYQLINSFHIKFFEQHDPGRTRKHIAFPAKGSSAKRLNMYLRWMVRQDNRGVDFGLWDFISPSELFLPLDVHTGRVTRKLDLLKRKSNDWKAVEEVTEVLRLFDNDDPIKYDFAIFGLGVFEKILVMGNQWFQFKEFLVKQDKTAMKVGTDGTLLGAWTNVPETGTVLDIGTGTGLIALMVAQRSQGVNITALEIEENAYEQANENIVESKWKDRIKVIKGSFIDYAKKTNELYDLIICNPPFYKTKNPGEDKNRAIARHSASLEINELMFYTQKLLKNNGIFSLILPSEQLDSAISIAQNESLFLQRITYIKPTPNKNPHRILLQFGRIKISIDQEELIIEEFGRHQYSDKFKRLVEPFYLGFKS